MSVTASRELVDKLCGPDVPLLVLHDFDKAGFSIAGTLQRDTRRYSFRHDVNVIDLGLRLADVQECKLQSEPVAYGKSDPRPNLRDNAATDEEIEFLCKEGDPWQGYAGERVELNAFISSGDFLRWIESKLEEHGIEKVVPDDVTLERAYRRAAIIHIVNEQIEGIVKDAHKKVNARRVSPGRIARKVKDRLKESPALSWDQVVAEIEEEARS